MYFGKHVRSDKNIRIELITVHIILSGSIDIDLNDYFLRFSKVELLVVVMAIALTLLKATDVSMHGVIILPFTINY